MDLGKKLKAIRIAEGLTQDEFSQLIDVPLVSVRSYELGKRSVNEKNLMKVTKHERFDKYAYWIATDKTLPESGQIAPDFTILLELGIVEKIDSDKKTA
ncbi:helix-turn-helix domain-containing protein [Vibrio maritimus]|uniref:helix-turn-helix domain-containing protein n=1 Tax=Vibrio maritimus TaxID=990268 RepID=UPI001F173230|nr:helix-turn-helix transcriptional regulator [Vibrio maritimus]